MIFQYTLSIEKHKPTWKCYNNNHSQSVQLSCTTSGLSVTQISSMVGTSPMLIQPREFLKKRQNRLYQIVTGLFFHDSYPDAFYHSFPHSFATNTRQGRHNKLNLLPLSASFYHQSSNLVGVLICRPGHNCVLVSTAIYSS